MRQYQPLWNLLKKNHSCRVSALPSVHARIIKAVSKEKYGDLTYKLELSEVHKTASLEHTVRGNIIEFTLKFTIGTDDI